MKALTLIILLLLTTLSIAEDKSAPPFNSRKITVGMGYKEVGEILSKSNWQKLEEKKEYDPHPAYKTLYRTVRYKMDTRRPSLQKGMTNILVTLKFSDGKLSQITKDFDDLMPSTLNLYEINVE